jgi:hypothetical protein
MLKLAYVGIAFALVFYLVFSLAVRFMELTQKARNKARLIILLASLIIFSISGVTAGVLSIQSGLKLYGVIFLVLGISGVIFTLSILFEIHQINTRVRMRRFMVLFDIVDRFHNEGKTHDEIFEYLTKIQKLKNKEASDFLEFISDPINHEFLVDVNAKIQEAKMLQKAENDYYR